MNSTANWLLAAIILYSLLLVYLGRRAAAKKGNDDSENYFHAGRQGSVFNIIVYAAAQWGAIILLSELESSTLQGVSVVWYGLGTLVMTALMAGWVITPLRKEKAITISGFLGDRFGERVRLLSSLAIGLFMPVFSVATLVGTAQVLQVLYQVPAWETVGLCSAVLLAYVLFGGMLSLEVTGPVNGIMLYLGAAVLTGEVLFRVGAHRLLTGLPASYYNPVGVGLPLILVWLGTWVASALVAQTQIQMVLTCRDEATGRKGLYLSMIPLFLMTVIAPVSGLGLRLLFPHQTDGFVATALLLKDLPSWAGILIVLSLWCASLVWAAPNQFSGAVSLGRDLVQSLGLLRPGMAKLLTQVFMVFLTIILFVLAALRPSQSAWWSVFAFAIRNASQLGPMLAALAWAAMSPGAACFSLVVGGSVAFVWYALASFSTTTFFLGVHPLWVGSILALLAAVLWMAFEASTGRRVKAVWGEKSQYFLSIALVLLGGYILYDGHTLLGEGIIGPLAFVWSILFFFLAASTIVQKSAVIVPKVEQHDEK